MREYYAASLSEFYNIVNKIALKEKEEGRTVDERQYKRQIPLLWYRGLTENWHNLLPTLYRGPGVKDTGGAPIYNQIKRKEDARYQHFKSRTFHLVKTNPSLESEWLEIYQHHYGKTRLMDWTESAKTALCFAVEAFLDSRSDAKLNHTREIMTPTVTVINPCKLNQRVYRYFYSHDELIKNAIQELFYPDLSAIRNVVDNIKEKMRENEEIFLGTRKDGLEMSGIVSLCVLEDMRNLAGDQLLRRVASMEFNPFFYLILRYYTDALPICIRNENDRVLPPLAVLHPYHSERIRKQRGTFSVYPNYVFNHKMMDLYDQRHIDVRAMERQLEVDSLLSRIYIINPQQIAEELLYAGERRTELYPGLDDNAFFLETEGYDI